MKNILIVVAVLCGVFLLGRWTKHGFPDTIIRTDTLPPVVRVDTIRDTMPMPVKVAVVRHDTIRDTVDGKPVYVPIPISRYLFTYDSTYRMEVEGYNVQAKYVEVYPRTITQTIRQQIETPGKPRRWGIGVSAGVALTPQGAQPYIGIGVQYNLIAF